MERELREAAPKWSTFKVEKFFTSEGLKCENMSISPWIRFKDLNSYVEPIEWITIGVLCGGSAKIQINGNSYHMHTNNIFLLGKDSQIGEFKCSKACEGYLISFSSSALEALRLETSDMISVNMAVSNSPVVSVDDCVMTGLHSIVAQVLFTSRQQGNVYRHRAVASLTSALFYNLASVILSNQKRLQESASKSSRSEEIFLQFIELVSAKCCEYRLVEYYAEELGITAKYLSLICKRQSGKNASKIIDDAVIHRAKELLSQHGLSVQDIASQMNFVSQSFFGKYFKQRVGISPSRYRGSKL